MGLTKPFAFLGASAEAGFDPTLGGTITPYFWYDFTDTSTMTFRIGSTVDIEGIDSKGSNTGSIVKGTSAKYSSPYYIYPELKSDSSGNYAFFSGSVNGGGTQLRNSSLARKYGSGNYQTDGDFSVNNPATFITFCRPDWKGNPDWLRMVSYKGNTGVQSAVQPEEYNPVAFSNGTNYPGDNYFSTGSFASSNNYSLQSQTYNNIQLPTNLAIIFSYNGSGDITDDKLNYWHSSVYRDTPSGGTYADSDGGRSSSELSITVRAGREGNTLQHEGYTIGGRSRDTEYQGAKGDVRHSLLYNVALSNAQIDALIASYKAAYPLDGLNGS